MLVGNLFGGVLTQQESSESLLGESWLEWEGWQCVFFGFWFDFGLGALLPGKLGGRKKKTLQVVQNHIG